MTNIEVLQNQCRYIVPETEIKPDNEVMKMMLLNVGLAIKDEYETANYITILDIALKIVAKYSAKATDFESLYANVKKVCKENSLDPDNYIIVEDKKPKCYNKSRLW